MEEAGEDKDEREQQRGVGGLTEEAEDEGGEDEEVVLMDVKSWHS